MTDHEKLRVHSRPSSEFLAAMPIKKRRFILPPSPPHESPSQSLGDCVIPEKKPESSELGLPCSETGGNPAEVNIVKGEFSRESHDSPLRTASCAIPEKKPEPSVPGSPFPETGCTSAQVNIVTGKDSSEPCELPSPASTDCYMPGSALPENGCTSAQVNFVAGKGSSEPCELPSPASTDHFILEKKPVPPFSRNGGNPVLVNAMTSENAYFKPFQATGAGCGISDKKHESLELHSSFSKSGVNPTEASDVAGQNASHKSYKFPYPTTQADGISEKKPEPSKLESTFSKTGGNPGQVNSVTEKVAFSESSGVPMTRDLMNICPKPEILPTFNDQGCGVILATNFQDRTGNMQDTVLNSKCAAWLVSGNMVTPSAATQAFMAPGMEWNVEGMLTPSGGISVKQEISATTSSDTKLKADSCHLSLNRSNWDLNTTMDAWEGSTADSVLNSGGADSSKRDLGGIQNKRFELGLKPVLFEEPIATDMSLKNYELQKNNQQPKLASRCSPVVDSNSEACLDLQLKPSFLPNPCVTSGKHDVSREMPFLSLGMKATSSTFSQPLAIGRTVKSEPIENDQKDAGKVHLGVLRSHDLKQVKSEPCEGQQISIKMIPDNMNLACRRGIKPGPLENQSLGCVRSSEGSSFHVGQESHSLDPQSTLVHQNACKDDSKTSDAALKPLVSSSVLHTCTSKPNTNISNDSYDMVDKARDLVNQASILGNDMTVTTDMTRYSNGIVIEPSALGSDSLVSDGNGMNSLPEVRETSSLPVATLPETLASNGEEGASVVGAAEFVVQMDASNIHHSPNVSLEDEVLGKSCANSKVVEVRETSSLPVATLPETLASHGEEGASVVGAAEFVVQMDASNIHHSANVSLEDEVLGKSCANSKVVESDEVECKAGVSSEVIDEPCDSTCKSESSHVATGTINSVRKKGGKADDDYEDGEVRYPALNGAVEGSCVVTDEQEVKAADSIGPVDVPASTPLPVDENETKVDGSKEGNALNSKESDVSVLENKVLPSSAVGTLTADSGKRILSKTIRRAPKDHLKNDKDQEKNLKSRDLSSKTIPADNQPGASSSEHQNAGPSIAKKYVSSKTEPSEKVGATREANDRGNRRIINLNSASNCSASGKWKSTSDRLMSSRGEEERAINRSFRRERSHSRGSRDESSNERCRKVDSQRHYGHPVEKCRPAFLQMRSRTDRLNANPDHLLEQINTSNGIRYSRPMSAVGVGIGASPDGSNQMTRKLTSEEMQNPSRLPCQRRSPGGRVQIQLGRHPVRDISPSSRCIGRDVPDFALLAHEEKLRNLPEDMVEHSMLSHSHSRSQYERAEGIILHRERRSLSPPLRRGGPFQISPNCQNSSPRTQQRPTHQWSPPRRTSDDPNHQWSPPRRTSDGISGQRDLGHCRSPPIMRINRMQSPHEHPCFPEEVIVRRRGSPPYITRLPNDMVDVDPSRERDFPRLVRGPNRNMRRFNMIDPREMMEEEYFGPHLVHSQIREYGVDDEFVEDRRCDERRGPIRPFRQHCVAGDNEGENFRFHDEDGPPRGSRIHPDDIEGFPEDGGPRDFDVRFRNRLGNPSRLRGIAQEQEDNYRHNGEQEWRDTAFNEGRPKRRRF